MDATDLPILDEGSAATYASWFATLADPTRVRVLHAVSASPEGLRVGELAKAVDIAQATASHHLRLLADAGFVTLAKEGTATVAAVNPACCTGLPHAADAVMGTIKVRRCCPEDVPDDVSVREMVMEAPVEEAAILAIYAQGMATRNATFTTEVPSAAELSAKWLPGHRWVAEIDGEVAGWAALSETSTRACYAGVAETQLYVAEAFRGRRVGVALIDRLVRAADAGGLWTLQAAIFPENRASLRLHRAAGFRTIGVRERIGQLDGVWRDTVLLERRR